MTSVTLNRGATKTLRSGYEPTKDGAVHRAPAVPGATFRPTGERLFFGVLGPFEVRTGQRVLPLGGIKQRAVLAVLTLRANEVVSTDSLIEALWADDPPPSATTALHGYVSNCARPLSRSARPGETQRSS